MFESPVDSLDQLDEYEFKALIDSLVLNSGTWDEYVDLYEEEPAKWIVEWAKHLETDFIYSLSDLDPVWTCGNWIGDPRSKSYWLYSENSDYTFIQDRVPTSGGELTKEALWPLVLEDLESIGDSILFGTLSINSTWIAASDIGSYLRDLMKKHKMTQLKGGDGPTVDEWLALQFPKSPL
jgi:hypothetical protein